MRRSEEPWAAPPLADATHTGDTDVHASVVVVVAMPWNHSHAAAMMAMVMILRELHNLGRAGPPAGRDRN